MFIEDQAFSPLNALAPLPPHPTSPQQVVSLSNSPCVSPVELNDGRDGEGGSRGQPNYMTEESLLLNKKINTLWFSLSKEEDHRFCSRPNAKRLRRKFFPL
jgi:hypothetical protein